MAFLVDESFLPATLTIPPMSDEQFAEFCSEHPDLFFEVTAEGELIVMPPDFSFTGIIHREILVQLDTWAQQDGRGIVNDATSGFVLPNGARRSPDISWMLKSRVLALDPKKVRRCYFPFSPDFLVEVKSATDRPRVLREKMREWIANGSALAWLIDPDTRTVEIYSADREPRLLATPERAEGEGPIAGFTLETRRVWEPAIGITSNRV